MLTRPDFRRQRIVRNVNLGASARSLRSASRQLDKLSAEPQPSFVISPPLSPIIKFLMCYGSGRPDEFNSRQSCKCRVLGEIKTDETVLRDLSSKGGCMQNFILCHSSSGSNLI